MGLDYSDLVGASADLHAVPRRFQPRARHLVRDAGNGTVTDAKVLVQVETGTLKDSISVEFDGDGLGFVAGPEAYYGVYVEGGDSNNAPQPFMVPAFDNQLDDLADDLGDTAKSAFR